MPVPFMHIEELRSYCLSFPATAEGFPFDEQTLVFKVGGKMFALADVNSFESINLKCLPETGVELRERYAGITPGYHMNKKHWITVKCNADVSRELVLELIRSSYELVVNSLTKKVKHELALGQIPLERKDR
jgi:predicted DNA-binding protein (MmcQ/YjbR family)